MTKPFSKYAELHGYDILEGEVGVLNNDIERLEEKLRCARLALKVISQTQCKAYLHSNQDMVAVEYSETLWAARRIADKGLRDSQ